MDEFVPRSEYMERIGRSDDRMREVNNVRMIRDTISYWADGLIT